MSEDDRNTPGDTPAASRPRSGRRRPGVDVVLAAVLPLVCLAVLLVARPGSGEQTAASVPRPTALTTASVVCPSALAATGADAVGLSTLADGPTGDATGSVSVGLGASSADASVRTGSVTAVSPGTGAVVVSGSGAVGPGLVAGRSGASPLSATDCPPVRGDQWFTGVGAGATHDSVLELINPVAGTAEVDVSLWSSTGAVEVDQLRGVSVAGGTATQLDLGQLAPRRGSLAVQVHVDRGQLATSVIDSEGEIGSDPASRDWLPAQVVPSTGNLLLGLASGAGSRTLTVMNPGDDEARATLELVTATGVFAPAGVDPVRVPAGSTASVSLTDVLQQQVDQGAIGVLVTSTTPVTAGLRQVTGGDLSALAPAPALSTSSAAVVPAGAKRLLLAGPSSTGRAAVAWFDADGNRLGGQTVPLKPESGADVTLPDDAALVTVAPLKTTVRAAVVTTTDQGTAVVALRELQRTGLVPDVRPGLP